MGAGRAKVIEVVRAYEDEVVEVARGAVSIVVTVITAEVDAGVAVAVEVVVAVV